MSRIPAQGAVVSVSALAVVASVYLMGGAASGSTIDASTYPLSLTATASTWSGSAFGATAVTGVSNAQMLSAASGAAVGLVASQEADPSGTTAATETTATTDTTATTTVTTDPQVSEAAQGTQAASTGRESAASITGNFVPAAPVKAVAPVVVKAAPKPTAVVKPKVVLTPQSIAQELAAKRGWTGAEWVCLNKLWQHESKYQITARNSRSGAYGIPQALPASKMATAGADWRTDATTQVTWGLNYIRSRYGNPCEAWSHELRHGSY
jgi:hypothetical protein